jgi:hypothetical protein
MPDPTYHVNPYPFPAPASNPTLKQGLKKEDKFQVFFKEKVLLLKSGQLRSWIRIRKDYSRSGND